MILQKLIFQKEEMPEAKELYYHSSAEPQISDAGMHIPAGSSVRFDTYFNAFISKAWAQYTNIKKVSVRILISGKGSARLWGDREEPLIEQDFLGEQELEFLLDLSESPYAYLEIYAAEAVMLLSGSIAAAGETEKAGLITKEVRLALVICTYNRRRDITKNVRLLKQHNSAIEGEKAPLEEIYVIDNACNLDSSEIEEERVRLIPNQNTGGAGGFTRGLKEAIKKKELTHIILMDDDVCIEFEAFRRTKAFLSYIKPEYAENFLGGAMFRTDMPYVLHAAGEDWADGHIRNPYKDMDMRKFLNVVEASECIKEKQAYAGWWYCCIPRSHVEKKGFPMPFFLHCDDVEYGLRSRKPPIYLNGVAVWHEEFEDKRVSAIEYYDVRNRLITNAIYKENGKKRDAFYILCERFYATVFRYRYKDFELSVKAAKDFLKGPEWLESVDSEELHKSLGKYGYIMQEVKELPETLKYPVKSKAATISRYFFPASGKETLRMGAPVSAYAGKKKVLLVELKGRKGFLAEKSWKETWKCVGKLFHILAVLFFRYEKARQTWENSRKNCEIRTDKVIYICSTYYHVYISILKVWKLNQKADIFLCDDIEGYEDLAKKLEKEKIFNHIYCYVRKGENPNRPHGYLPIFLTGHKKSAAWIGKDIATDLQKYSLVYIFHDGIELGRYLMDIKKEYYLLEDAKDFFKIVERTPSSSCLEKKNLKYRLRYILNYGYFWFGQNRWCKGIEVNDREGIVLPQRKISVCRKDALQAEVTQEQKEKIFSVFLPEFLKEEFKTDKVLILTQPLYRDGYVESEAIQKKIYEDIIEKELSQGYQVVLKPHPRDKTEYDVAQKDGIVLPKEFPAEILNYGEGICFQKAVAVSSTAVFGLCCVKEKILLGEKVLDRYV